MTIWSENDVLIWLMVALNKSCWGLLLNKSACFCTSPAFQSSVCSCFQPRSIARATHGLYDTCNYGGVGLLCSILLWWSVVYNTWHIKIAVHRPRCLLAAYGSQTKHYLGMQMQAGMNLGNHIGSIQGCNFSIWQICGHWLLWIISCCVR